jgi:hypothetical protein
MDKMTQHSIIIDIGYNVLQVCILTLVILAFVGGFCIGKANASEDFDRTTIRDVVRAEGTNADNYLYDACDRAYPENDTAFLKCLEILKVKTHGE